MSHEAKPTVPPDKRTLRRQIRAKRRSPATQRDRDVDPATIATAASAFLDTLALPPQGMGGHPAYRGRPCVAIYRSLPTEPPTGALAEMLLARGLTVIAPEMLPDKDLDWHELKADGRRRTETRTRAIGDPRVIFTPALAVDHSGTRRDRAAGAMTGRWHDATPMPSSWPS